MLLLHVENLLTDVLKELLDIRIQHPHVRKLLVNIRMLLPHVAKLLRKERREGATVCQRIFFAVPPHLENNGPMRRESACATDKEERAMNNLSVWTTQYQQPLLLACGGLLALALLLKCGERKGRLPHLLAIVIVLAMLPVAYLGKADKAVWIPALGMMLTAALTVVLAWKTLAGSGQAENKPDGMQQYEEELKKLRQQILDLQASGSMADDKQRQLLEAQLQAVQGHLADIRESWKEEQLRRKAADEALDQMKCQMPDARIEKAQVSLRQGDTKAAKETFAEVRKQAGKAAALAAHHEGKLAEGEVNYAEAMELYRTAVLLEKDNPDYLLAAGNMACKLADYGQAQEWHKQLLTIREAEGKDSPEFALAQNDLAVVYKKQGHYAAAEALYQRSLSITEKTLGKDHPDVATILNNLAALYKAQGKYAEAEPLYKRDLEIIYKSLGTDHPDMAITLNNLALLYEAQDRHTEAEPLHKHSLEIKEKFFGKNHPDVANSLNNLAGLYYQQEKYAEAEPLYKRALEIRENKLGKDHPDVATTLNNLAGLYKTQGRYAEAEPLFQRALSIMQAKLPAGHSRIIGCQKDYDEMKEKMAGM